MKPRQRRWYFTYMSVLIGLALSLAGCAAALDAPTSSAEAEPSRSASQTKTPSPPEATATVGRGQLPVTPRLPEVAPMTPAPIVEPVPGEIFDLIMSDAEKRTGLKRTAMTVIRAEQVVWNDGSLGCAQPGVLYTQALVDGYWIVVQVGPDQYDYRAAATGYFFLCERPVPIP